MERYIAIDFVCAWPNLTLMPNGEIIATIFNQPCHGRWQGDVECWASANGRFWERRGVPAPHDPETNRMNVAAGLAANGDLIVLASGWSHRPPQPQPRPVLPHESYSEDIRNNFKGAHGLEPWVCRSADGGRTWTHEDTVALPGEGKFFIPFGDVVAAGDGLLGTTFYSEEKTWFVRSADDGRSWTEHFLIAEGINETDILRVEGSVWLAAARRVDGGGMKLFRSADAGETWAVVSDLTVGRYLPGHLCRLADGRILLHFGVRSEGLHGVGIRLSEDEGKSWAPSRLLAAVDPHADCGYPAGVQLADGTIVSAYYAANAPNHQRYHMGVMRWRPEDIESLDLLPDMDG